MLVPATSGCAARIAADSSSDPCHTEASRNAATGSSMLHLKTGVHAMLKAKNSWYGTQTAEERLAARIARHADSQDPVAREAPRLRHRAGYPRNLGRRDSGRRRLALSGAA